MSGGRAAGAWHAGGVVLALVLAASGCGARTRTTADSQPPAPGPTPAGSPDTRASEPPSRDSATARCAVLLARGSGAECLSLAATAQDDAGNLRWLHGRSHASAGNHELARGEWDALAASPHPLAPWAAIAAARSELDALEAAAMPPSPSTSLTSEQRASLGTRVTKLAALPGTFVGHWDGLVLRARAAIALGDRPRGEHLFDRALETGGPAQDREAVRLRLADSLVASGTVASLERAIRLYRNVAITAPSGDLGTAARGKLATALGRLPDARRAVLGAVSSAEQLTLARAWLAAFGYAEAEREASLAAAHASANEAERCEARLIQGRAILRQRDRPRGIDHMRRLLTRCHAADVAAPALYELGRALNNLDRYDDAITEFDRLAHTYGAHRLGDDGAYLAAVATLAAGRKEEAKRRCTQLIAQFGNGDMREDARFLLAWIARKDSDWATARRELEALARQEPAQPAEDAGGRAAYWLGRTQLDASDRAGAITTWERLLRDWPLSYYAQQALGHLRDVDAARATAALSAWQSAADAVATAQPAQPEERTAPFVRAIALLDIGEFKLARRELDAAGVFSENVRAALGWRVAWFLGSRRAYPDALRLVRRELSGFRRHAPVGTNRVLWQIAYPAAFPEEVANAATASDISPALLRAIAREESSFEPTAVSPAHAYGLAQLILPTARRLAAATGVEATPATLKQPDINLALGAAYMASLRDRYGANIAMIPPAYNAGEGAVDEWLERNAGQPLDEWIENISYEETRRYTRRVLQTYGVYSFLDSGQLAQLPASIPAAP